MVQKRFHAGSILYLPLFLCYLACCPFLGFNGFADNKKFINFGNQTNPQHQP